MFLDQSKILPFAQVTPIRLPDVINLTTQYYKFYESKHLLDISELEIVFRNWYRPLIDVDQFPYMYFMNNGITQALEYMTIHYKNTNIKMLLGDYFWLKTIGCANEVIDPVICEISYDTNPSSIDGAIHTTVWNSTKHLLDGAYVGTCLDVVPVPANTEMLFLGFSKNLGLSELRCGLILSKNKINTLDVLQRKFGYVGTQSFNAVARVCRDLDITALAKKLKTSQAEFCKHYPQFLPSQCALLATTKDETYKFYKRQNGVIRIPLGESITKWIAT